MMSEQRMITAYLGLGSNLGDREGFLKGAREVLAGEPEIEVAASSPLYRTEPVGGPSGQESYLNAVIEVKTSLCARKLLHRALAAEDRFGRRRLERWGPRTLDVDLLFYGDQVLQEPDLMLPHPRLHQRRFVLAPLNDLAPDLVHPTLGKTVRQLLAALPAGETVCRISRIW